MRQSGAVCGPAQAGYLFPKTTNTRAQSLLVTRQLFGKICRLEKWISLRSQLCFPGTAERWAKSIKKLERGVGELTEAVYYDAQTSVVESHQNFRPANATARLDVMKIAIRADVRVRCNGPAFSLPGPLTGGDHQQATEGQSVGPDQLCVVGDFSVKHLADARRMALVEAIHFIACHRSGSLKYR